MKKIVSLAVLSLLATLVTLSGAQSPADLAGRWTSPTCEDIGNDLYLTREFELSDTLWSIDFTLYADEACTVGLAQGRNEGIYNLGAESADGREGNFGFSKKHYTPLVADFVTAFDDAGCGSAPWELGVEQDISSTGCPATGTPPIVNCPVEYDLVKLEDDLLYFGERSGGMCDADNRTNTFGLPVQRQ